MDNLDMLPVKFYLGGEFVHQRDIVDYVGGDEAMSHVERDKVSLPEIVGHLKDHMTITDKDTIHLHWLFPGKELNNGLRPLSDDKVCIYMSECITEDGVADIYAEVIHVSSKEEEESDYENEMSDSDSEEGGIVAVPIQVLDASNTTQLGDLESFKAFYKSPVKPPIKDAASKGKKKADEPAQAQKEDDDSDVGDADNSENDEEAQENRKHKKNQGDVCRAIVPAGPHVVQPPTNEDLDVGNDAPYFGSSEEASYDDEEGLDTSGIRRKSRFPRYDEKATIPVFSIGMTFRGREEFKQAVVKYGIVMRRHIEFIKDEKKRIRAKCSWEGCPWLIHASDSSKCDWFQVQTYIPQHRCPQRRDNKLVTARRIAEKYEPLIKTNPSWKL
ncbi:hypothetical protein EJB05_04855, partial [Eragrostis curvula]